MDRGDSFDRICQLFEESDSQINTIRILPKKNELESNKI